jgi:hypothetical protein
MISMRFRFTAKHCLNTIVPEPSSVVALAIGVAIAAGLRRRRLAV